MFTADELRDFANTQRRGYLKQWKASGMVGTLGLVPDLIEDDTRLVNYVTNCLQMEGFSDTGIMNIVEFIKENS